MTRKADTWLSWVLATIGLIGTGFAAGLHRLVWGTFWVLAVLWCAFIWAVVHKDHGDLSIDWLLALAPPIVVGLVLRLLEGIVFAFFGGLHRPNGDPTVTSPVATTEPMPSSAEKRGRQRLGYDRERRGRGGPSTQCDEPDKTLPQ